MFSLSCGMLHWRAVTPEVPRSPLHLLQQMALGRLNTMRSFRIRDIAYVLPRHLHGNVTAQKLMMKAIMASENGELSRCLEEGCTGYALPCEQKGVSGLQGDESSCRLWAILRACNAAPPGSGNLRTP